MDQSRYIVVIASDLLPGETLDDYRHRKFVPKPSLVTRVKRLTGRSCSATEAKQDWPLAIRETVR
jgi:hypothetical protein